MAKPHPTYRSGGLGSTIRRASSCERRAGESYYLRIMRASSLLHISTKTQITSYGTIGAWEPLSDPRICSDARARIVLHMNWKAQTLPIIMGGLPSRAHLAAAASASKSSSDGPSIVDVLDWNALPQPPVEEIRRCSPLAQVRNGNYATPTFVVHGMADDLIPWQQSHRTVEEMKARGIDARLVLVPGAPHVCDTSRDPESKGWQAVLEAYRWLGDRVFPQAHHD